MCFRLKVRNVESAKLRARLDGVLPLDLKRLCKCSFYYSMVQANERPSHFDTGVAKRKRRQIRKRWESEIRRRWESGCGKFEVNLGSQRIIISGSVASSIQKDVRMSIGSATSGNSPAE